MIQGKLLAGRLAPIHPRFMGLVINIKSASEPEQDLALLTPSAFHPRARIPSLTGKCETGRDLLEYQAWWFSDSILDALGIHICASGSVLGRVLGAELACSRNPSQPRKVPF